MEPFGYESFENNEAVEWLEELLESDDLALIQSSLHSAAEHTGDSVGLVDARRALAAAETVAVWHGHAGEGAPLEVLDWVAQQETPLPSETLELARRAVERVLGGSEMREQWIGIGEIDDWKLAVDDLLQRLHS